MTTTTTPTKILNRAYCRHLIKQAAETYQSSSSAGQPAIITSGTQPIGGGMPKAPTGHNPGIVRSALGGLGEGAQNIFSGMGNAAIGLKNTAFGLGEATLGNRLRHAGDVVGSLMSGGKSLGQLKPNYWQQAQRESFNDGMNMAGAGLRDTAESFGQMVGVNNAFDENWNYVGAQSPQNATQQHMLREQKYFSHPEDRYLGALNYGVNSAADAAASFLPSAAAAPLAAARLANVPQIARAGQAVNQAIKSTPLLDKTLQGGSVLTGLPMHPEMLQGGRLAALAGASQTAQYFAPALAPGVVGLTAQTAGMKPTDVQQLTQNTAAGAQKVMPYMPAVAADNAIRTLHPDGPEILDAVTMPAIAQQTAQMNAAVNTGLPVLEQKMHDNMIAAAKQREQAANSPDAVARSGGISGGGQMNVADPQEQQPQQQPAPPEPAKFVKDAIPDASPEVQDQVAGHATAVQQAAAQNPGVAKAVTDPESDEAKSLRQQGLENLKQENAGDAPTNPQDFGSWMNGLMTQFQQMDPMSQIAMGLGLGTGAIGLIGGLMGGGIGSFLLGALGLGAAGFMGANAGMFGQDAQTFAKDTMFNIGAATGMIQVKKDDLTPLLAKNPMAELSKQAPKIDYAAAALNPAEYAKTIGPQVQQAEEKLKQLQQMVEWRPEQLVQVTRGLSVQEAQAALNNAKAVLADAQNPQGQLGSQLALAREFMADPVAVRNREMQKRMGPVAAGAGRMAADYVVPGGGMLLNLAGQGIQRGLNYFKRSSDMNIAQQIIVEELVTKAARCWAGYEPVPGKKPYSEDSCRPVGGKKKKKKKNEKKAAGPVLLQSATPKLPDSWLQAYKTRVNAANTAMKKLAPNSLPNQPRTAINVAN